tara:strand:- start:159 stop:554 length:396 start_codon:yes stop_codon:yes gene_type:complete
MKFFFLISICFFTSFPCFAKWKKIIENKNFSEFVEIDNVKKKNGIIYLWTLKNFVTEQKDLERSLKFYSRYDCKKIKYEVLSIISYKRQMGKGRDFYYKKNVKDYSDNSNWIYPNVDGEAYKLMKIICNLK